MLSVTDCLHPPKPVPLEIPAFQCQLAAASGPVTSDPKKLTQGRRLQSRTARSNSIARSFRPPNVETSTNRRPKPVSSAEPPGPPNREHMKTVMILGEKSGFQVLRVFRFGNKFLAILFLSPGAKKKSHTPKSRKTNTSRRQVHRKKSTVERLGPSKDSGLRNE